MRANCSTSATSARADGGSPPRAAATSPGRSSRSGAEGTLARAGSSSPSSTSARGSAPDTEVASGSSSAPSRLVVRSTPATPSASSTGAMASSTRARCAELVLSPGAGEATHLAIGLRRCSAGAPLERILRALRRFFRRSDARITTLPRPWRRRAPRGNSIFGSTPIGTDQPASREGCSFGSPHGASAAGCDPGEARCADRCGAVPRDVGRRKELHAAGTHLGREVSRRGVEHLEDAATGRADDRSLPRLLAVPAAAGHVPRWWWRWRRRPRRLRGSGLHLAARRRERGAEACCRHPSERLRLRQVTGDGIDLLHDRRRRLLELGRTLEHVQKPDLGLLEILSEAAHRLTPLRRRRRLRGETELGSTGALGVPNTWSSPEVIACA